MNTYYLPDILLGAKGVTVSKIDKNDGAYILAKKNKNKPKNAKNHIIVHKVICKCYKEKKNKEEIWRVLGKGQCNFT